MHPLQSDIREYELQAVRPLLPAGARILEIGSGNGLQALRLTEWGYQVVKALDIDGSQRLEDTFYDVEFYDGVNLPLEDASVDVVYSSNVFEHVKDVPGLLAETRRVLAPGGRCVHVLPSPAWRGWSLLTRYLFLVQLATRRRVLPPASKGAGDAWEHARKEARHGGGRLGVLKKALIEAPHGEFPSALSELHHYKAGVWRDKFEAAGFCVVQQQPAGVFYTCYGISRLSLSARERLATRLGSACTVFVLEPAA